MLVINCDERFTEAKAFAEKMGLSEQFQSQLDYLDTYANGPGCTYAKEDGKNTKCVLYSDRAPYSFGFVVWKFDGSWNMWFEGGLIYEGPGCPADGSAPSFTVSLNPSNGWHIHT